MMTKIMNWLSDPFCLSFDEAQESPDSKAMTALFDEFQRLYRRP